MSEFRREKDRPWQDPIVAEVRAARQQLLAKVGYDLHALCELLRSQQAAEGRKSVRRTPRPVQSPRVLSPETQGDKPCVT